VTSDPPPSIAQAFDELRFGRGRTLDVRSSMPTAASAVARAEAWLREKQVEKAGEVLIVTGRGAGSPGGVPVVKPAIRKLLTSLTRRGVVASVQEHTAGAYVVALAPVTALLDAPRRSRSDDAPPRPADPVELRALAPETRTELRALAEESLVHLGAPRDARYVHDEMLRQYALLTRALAHDRRDHEGRLRTLITAARDAFVHD
jgi:hypothetical protein